MNKYEEGNIKTNIFFNALAKWIRDNRPNLGLSDNLHPGLISDKKKLSELVDERFKKAVSQLSGGPAVAKLILTILPCDDFDYHTTDNRFNMIMGSWVSVKIFIESKFAGVHQSGQSVYLDIPKIETSSLGMHESSKLLFASAKQHLEKNDHKFLISNYDDNLEYCYDEMIFLKLIQIIEEFLQSKLRFLIMNTR